MVMLSSKEAWAKMNSKSMVLTSGNQAEPKAVQWFVPQAVVNLVVLYVWIRIRKR